LIRPILDQDAAGIAVTGVQIATVARAANDTAVPSKRVLILCLGV